MSLVRGKHTVFAAVITCAGVDEPTRFFTGSVFKFRVKKMALTQQGALKIGEQAAKNYRRVVAIDVLALEVNL